MRGGECEYNKKTYEGCSNKCLPLKSKAIKIPYEMYFSKESSSWNNKALSFINYNKSGYSYAKAYLITQEKFKEVQKQEGLSWYNMVI